MLLLVLSFALLTAASFFLLRATNGGENDTVVAVKVRALSDVHNGQFEALMPSGCRKRIDMRRKSSSGYVSGLKAGDKWILMAGAPILMRAGMAEAVELPDAQKRLTLVVDTVVRDENGNEKTRTRSRETIFTPESKTVSADAMAGDVITIQRESDETLPLLAKIELTVAYYNDKTNRSACDVCKRLVRAHAEG